MEIKIEKGIPLPSRRGDLLKWNLPFHKMSVGDSFKLTQTGGRTSIYHEIKLFTNKHKRKRFTVQVLNKKAKTIRVWRIK